MPKRARRLGMLTGLLVAAACGPPASGRREILVFAASSLQDALRDIGTDFQAGGGAAVELNIAGSNVLARQIESGALGDVFVSADEKWMNELANNRLIADDTRAAILSNSLVAAVRKDSPLSAGRPSDLVSARFRALALADPEAVPAGRYAREALEKATSERGSVWEAVRDRIVPALDVRAALALAASDPEIVCIVYRTDALGSDRVRVLFEFPPADPPAIHYVAAVLAASAHPEEARAFVSYLRSSRAAGIFERHGFVALARTEK